MNTTKYAALSVLDAYRTETDRLNRVVSLEEMLAARLERAASHATPSKERMPWLGEDSYFNETFENYQALGELIACERILEIAAELRVVSLGEVGEKDA